MRRRGGGAGQLAGAGSGRARSWHIAAGSVTDDEGPAAGASTAAHGTQGDLSTAEQVATTTAATATAAAAPPLLLLPPLPLPLMVN